MLLYDFKSLVEKKRKKKKEKQGQGSEPLE